MCLRMTRMVLALLLLGLASPWARAATLTGHLYEDVNGNGARDAAEPCVSGFVELQSVDGLYQRSRVVECGTLLESYTFRDLPAGSYALIVTGVDAGYVLPEPAAVRISPADQVVQYDVAVRRQIDPNGAIYAIEGKVREDLLTGPNPVRPLADAVVLLRDDAGSMVQLTPTKTDGTYRFEKLLPGTYEVVAANPYGEVSKGRAAVTVPVAVGRKIVYSGIDFVKLPSFVHVSQIERLLAVGDGVRAELIPGRDDLRAIDGRTDAIRRLLDDGSLVVLDPAGTSLLRLGNGQHTTLLDTTLPDAKLARILAVETNRKGVSALFGVPASDPKAQAICRLDPNGRLTWLAIFPRTDPEQIHLAISNTDDRVTYIAPVDGSSGQFGLYSAGTGPPLERLRTGMKRQDGLRIDGFSDLTGDDAGEVAFLVALSDRDGRTEQAVMHLAPAGVPTEVARSGQPVRQSRSSASADGHLSQLYQPRIGPEGSVVFLGIGAGFVNCYAARPNGELTPLLEGTGWSRQPENFDFAIATDGAIAIRVGAGSPQAAAGLYLAPPLPSAAVREITARTSIQPVGQPAFGPDGLLFFLGARPATWPPDVSSFPSLGLLRYSPEAQTVSEVAVPREGLPLVAQGAALRTVPDQPLQVSGRYIAFAAAFDTTAGAAGAVGLFRVPPALDIGSVLPVATEGNGLPASAQVSSLQDFYHTGDGTLIINSFLTQWLAGGQALFNVGPPPAPPGARQDASALPPAAFRQQAVVSAPLLKKLAAKGQALGDGRTLDEAPQRFVFLAPGQWLFAARFTRDRRHEEGLFLLTLPGNGSKPRFQAVAVPETPIPNLAQTSFSGFILGADGTTLPSPSASITGDVVFKALLARGGGVSTSGLFHWIAGTPSAVVLSDVTGRSEADLPDRIQLQHWAAGPSGQVYFLERHRDSSGASVAALYRSTPSGRERLAISGQTLFGGSISGILTDAADVVVNRDGRPFLLGNGRTGDGAVRQGIFSLDAQGLKVATIQREGLPPGTDGKEYPRLAFAGDFTLRQDSACGDLYFEAGVGRKPAAPNGDVPLETRGLFHRTAAGDTATALLEQFQSDGEREGVAFAIPDDGPCGTSAGPQIAAVGQATADWTLAFSHRDSDGHRAIFRLWYAPDPLGGPASITSVLVAREGQPLKVDRPSTEPTLLQLDPTVSVNAAGNVVFKANIQDATGRHDALFRHSTWRF